MAFQAPNAGQGQANKKILEELQLKKRALEKRSEPNSPTASPIQSPMGSPVIGVGAEPQQMTSAQRAALQHAHANSVGYFITQDSSFGNLILPVLPRLENIIISSSK